MLQKLRPYPEYRNPGIPWLGEIPAHWKAERLKRVVKNAAEQTDARAADETYIALENVEGWTGKILPAIDDAEFESLVKRFEPEDVLFGKLRPYLAKVARPSRHGVCVGEFFVLRETMGAVRPEFLERLLRTAPFIHLVNSSTFGAKMPRADWNFVGNVEIAYPSREEQKHIVRLLDRVDMLVDRLIVTKQRLIEVLTEQKQAVIHRAVTRGLNPEAPMKPTSVDWIPEMPEHWEVMPIKRLFVRMDYGTSENLGSEGSVRVLTMGHIQNGEVELPEHGSLNDVPPGLILETNDLLFNRMNSPELVGKVGIFRGSSRERVSFASYLVRLRPTTESCSEYLNLLLNSHSFTKFARSQALVSLHQANLNSSRYGQMRVIVPSPKEQKAIAAWIREEVSVIDAAIERARREIDLIREYRTRLISDVVTGKLDVREEEKAAQPKKTVNPFHRAVLAAEIVDQYHGLSKFGWIKLQKAVILAERHLRMDEIQSEPQRAAAGPFDNQMMRSIHHHLEKQGWFKAAERKKGYKYIPMNKRGGHQKYFETYWGNKRGEFDRLLKLLRPMNTDQAEIVATLYMAWNDFLIHGEPVNDDRLVHEVLHKWDDSKRRFPEDRWRRAISWMRDNALVPQGFGTLTTVGLRNAAD